MRPKSSPRIALLALTAAAWTGMSGLALAQTTPAPAPHEIPQSQTAEHADNLIHLAALAKHPGDVGAIARKAVALFKQHDAQIGRAHV